MNNQELSPAHLAELRGLDTCAVANAIDTFNLRLRNEGYADSTIRCVFPKLPPIVGYAVTLKVVCSHPPLTGVAYKDRTDWWSHIIAQPEPRIVVIQDVDSSPGIGALLGEVHANILKALNCIGGITNGTVRDLPVVEQIPFQLFSTGVAVSHAYVHIVEFGCEVTIGGLKINSGDLLHCDQHGVLSVPKTIAAEIPAVAAKIADDEAKLIALCRSRNFTLKELDAAVKR